jgi:tetratricopeptide (TPR) repeat protein
MSYRLAILAVVVALNPFLLSAAHSCSSESEATIKRAVRFRDHSHFREAKTCCDRVIQSEPGCMNAYFLRAKILTELEHRTQALADVNFVIQRFNSYPPAYELRARIYDEQGKTRLAVDDIAKVIALNKVPKAKAAPLITRSVYYRKLGQFEEALADLTLSIKLDSTVRGAYNHRANLYLALGRYQKAIDDYTVAIKLSPPDDDHEILQLRGSRAAAFEKLGRHDLAAQDRKQIDAAARDSFGSFFREQK